MNLRICLRWTRIRSDTVKLLSVWIGKKKRDHAIYVITQKNILRRRSLLVNSLISQKEELKRMIQWLENILMDKALEWAREVYKAILEKVDALLMEHRDKRLLVKHIRSRWYKTSLGAVKVKRRQYRDEKEKRYRYLLDEVSGMEKENGHTSINVQDMALGLACTMSFRRSAEILKKTTPIDLSHQRIWKLLGKVADAYIGKTENETRHFLDTGEIPQGEGKKVARLMVEADGVMLSLQREKARKAEAKLGIAYEGWKQVGKDRYSTVNKTIFADTGNSDQYWAGMYLKLQKKYDLGSLRQTILGGDGASWVKEGIHYTGGQFQIDRYHLNRELCFALGPDKNTIRLVREACEYGDIEKAASLLSEARRKATGDQADKIARAARYLRNNSNGLRDYRLDLGEEGKGSRRTGAIEGNVDKLIVRRMKNQGMNWTLKGMRRMIYVRFLYLEGKLKDWLYQYTEPPSEVIVPVKKARRIIDKKVKEYNPHWLEAGLPALRGPHSSRPWALVLKSLTQGNI
ncbi:MAG: ISLre2 family transposase [Dehalococcoidia bacterium]|nr:ISLre2 family transposase [Dehalococcoidia bacterium]